MLIKLETSHLSPCAILVRNDFCVQNCTWSVFLGYFGLFSCCVGCILAIWQVLMCSDLPEYWSLVVRVGDREGRSGGRMAVGVGVGV